MQDKHKISVDQAKALTGARSDYHLAQTIDKTRQLVSLWRKRGYIGYDYADRILSGEIKADRRFAGKA